MKDFKDDTRMLKYKIIISLMEKQDLYKMPTSSTFSVLSSYRRA